MTARRIACAAAAALCAALPLAGCSGDRDTGAGRKIEAVVKRFALAHGPDACALLSDHAVVQVYGGGSYDTRAARRSCATASARFKGQAVEVTFVKIASSTGAHVTARTPDGKRYWGVSMVKSHDRWLIDGIAPGQKPS